MRTGRFLKSLFACAASLALLSGGHGVAQQPSPPPGGSAAAAGDIADFFTKVGDQIYEDCIFELSQEQLEVQQALIEAYIKQGAPSAIARQFAVRQIRPPKLSPKCERIKNLSKPEPDAPAAAPHLPLQKSPLLLQWCPRPNPKPLCR